MVDDRHVGEALRDVAALLAGACVAPVVLQVILLSSSLYASGTTLALGLPFLLGIGMAAPWPLAGAGLSERALRAAWRMKAYVDAFMPTLPIGEGSMKVTLPSWACSSLTT